MKIFIFVKPNSKMAKVEKIDRTHFKIWVKEPAKGGKANEAVIREVAAALNVPKSALAIVSGAFSRHKVVEIK